MLQGSFRDLADWRNTQADTLSGDGLGRIEGWQGRRWPQRRMDEDLTAYDVCEASGPESACSLDLLAWTQIADETGVFG